MALYDLMDVKEAAKLQNINFSGRKVSKDAAELGYQLKDIAECIYNLTPEEFKQTQYYDNRPPCDEYLCTHSVKCNDDGDDVIDELYVKFCLIDNYLVIDLASFHLRQF